MGVKFIFIISLMHTLSDKVRFVQRKPKPEEAFRTKKWMVLAEHLLAQAHIYIYSTSHSLQLPLLEQILYYLKEINIFDRI